MSTTTAAKTAGPDQHRRRGYASVNPFTGETVATFAAAGEAEIDDAITRAAAAFPEWRARPVSERAAAVQRAGALMADREEELAATITREMGKLIGESRFEVQLAASILRYYGVKGEELLRPEPLEVGTGEAQLVDAPLGVLLGIEPWNFPLYQVVRFAGPNLVLGNTVLVKHASNCPQSALGLQSVFDDAGVPPGVYTNVFLSVGDVPRVVEHPAVRGVSLTGSEGAGASVGELAGRNLKKCVLELGGSDPFVVLDAPDLPATVQAAAVGRLANTGQSCVAAKRFIVASDVYRPFVEALSEAFARLVPGDPADPGTTLGPLSSERAVDDLLAQVQDAVDQGAEVHVGGARLDRTGAFVAATVLTGVRPGMRAYHEELFGPVAVVHEAADDDEAVELANDTTFGLGGAVFCSDLQRARAVADRIESGMVWINHPTSSAPQLPFGGIKRSGFGRELSHLGIHEFANRKLVRTYPPGSPRGPVAG